jgi:hypothetical protein
MPHSQQSNTEWATRYRQALTTRHSHEDILNDRDFELLLEACRNLPAPRGFEARFICLLGGASASGPAKSRTSEPPGSIGTANSFESLSMSRAIVGTANDRLARKPLIMTSSPNPPPLRLVGSPKPSPLRDRFRSTYRYESSSVSNGLPTATMASPGRGPPSTGASRKPPSKRTSRDGFIRTVCGRLRPAITPTRAWPRCPYRH